MSPATLRNICYLGQRRTHRDSFKNVGTHFIENNSDLCKDCRYKDFGGHEEVKKQVGVMSFLFKNSGKS